jgi:hypothetical protein
MAIPSLPNIDPENTLLKREPPGPAEAYDWEHFNHDDWALYEETRERAKDIPGGVAPGELEVEEGSA